MLIDVVVIVVDGGVVVNGSAKRVNYTVLYKCKFKNVSYLPLNDDREQ